MSLSNFQRRSTQTGAIAISSAVLLILFGLFMALAFDSGRLYLEKRRLQQQADLAALQAAQLYCNGFDDTAAITQTVGDTLSDHGFNSADAANTLTVDIGELSTTNYRRQFINSAATESIRVTLTRTVPAAIFAGSVFNDITLTAEAVAKRDLQATLVAGSNLLTLDSTQSPILDSLLGGLLGSTINLSLASYQGLLDTNVNLLSLRDEMAGLNIVAQAATLEDIIAADVSMGDWLQVIYASLQADGEATALTLSAINEIITLGDASGSNAETLALDSILAFGASSSLSDEALNNSVPALPLILNSLLGINVGDTVGLGLTIDPSASTVLNALLGSSLSVSLTVNVAPIIAIGPFGYDESGDPLTLASSGDLSIQVNLQIPDPGASGSLLSVLTGLLAILADIEGDIAVSVDVGAGLAWLDRVDQCPRLLDRDINYAVSSESALTSVNVGSTADPSSPATLGVSLLGWLLPLPPIPIEVGATVSLNGVSGNDSYLVDLSDPDALPQGSGSGGTSLSDVLDGATVDISGALAGDVLSALVSDLVLPLLVGVADLALDPLLELLGITLGEVEYQVTDIDEAGGELKM